MFGEQAVTSRWLYEAWYQVSDISVIVNTSTFSYDLALRLWEDLGPHELHVGLTRRFSPCAVRTKSSRENMPRASGLVLAR